MRISILSIPQCLLSNKITIQHPTFISCCCVMCECVSLFPDRSCGIRIESFGPAPTNSWYWCDVSVCSTVIWWIFLRSVPIPVNSNPLSIRIRIKSSQIRLSKFNSDIWSVSISIESSQLIYQILSHPSHQWCLHTGLRH